MPELDGAEVFEALQALGSFHRPIIRVDNLDKMAQLLDHPKVAPSFIDRSLSYIFLNEKDSVGIEIADAGLKQIRKTTLLKGSDESWPAIIEAMVNNLNYFETAEVLGQQSNLQMAEAQ